MATRSEWIDGFSRHLPDLDNTMHYRSIDVSSFKELCRRWYPAIYKARPGKKEVHRGLDDIRESIVELRYYRQTMLIAPSGHRLALVRPINALEPNRERDRLRRAA